MSLRRASFVILVGLLVVLGLGGTAAAQYPPFEGAAWVDKSIVESGGTVEFRGGPFVYGSEVVIRDNGVFVGTVLAEESGSSLSGFFFIRLTLTCAGTHVLTGTGMGTDGDPEDPTPTGPRTVSAIVTVVGDACGLPRTGSDSILPYVGTGATLVVLGTGLVVVTRPRRRSRAI